LKQGLLSLTGELAKPQFKQGLADLSAHIHSFVQGTIALGTFAVKHVQTLASVFTTLTLAVATATAAMIAFKVASALGATQFIGLLGAVGGFRDLGAIIALTATQTVSATASMGVAIAGMVAIIYTGVEAWRAFKAAREEAQAGKRVEESNAKFAEALRRQVDSQLRDGALTADQAAAMQKRIADAAALKKKVILPSAGEGDSGERLMADEAGAFAALKAIWSEVTNIKVGATKQASDEQVKIAKGAADAMRQVELERLNYESMVLDAELARRGISVEAYEQRKRGIIEESFQIEVEIGAKTDQEKEQLSIRRMGKLLEFEEQQRRVREQKAAEEVEQANEVLNAIDRAYRDASNSKLQLLDEERDKNLRLLRDKVKDEEDFNIARLALDATYAIKRAGIERQMADQRSAGKLGALQNQQRGIEGNRFATDGEKAPLLIANLQKQIELVQTLQVNNAALAADFTQTEDTRLVASEKLLQLDTQRIELQEKLSELQSRDFTGTLRSGFVQMYNEWSNLGANLANGVLKTIGTAIDSLADGITGLIAGTQTWGQVWQQVGLSVINMIIKIMLQWAVAQLIGMALQAAGVTYSNALAIAAAAAWAPAAISASIASYGAAATVGLGAFAAAQVAGVAFSAGTGAIGGGFKEGGYTGDGPRDQVAGVVHRGEWVVNADLTKRLRPALEGLHMARNFQVASPDFSSFSAGGASQAVNVAPTPVQVVVVKSAEEFREFMESNAGKRIVVKHVRNDRGGAGLET